MPSNHHTRTHHITGRRHVQQSSFTSLTTQHTASTTHVRTGRLQTSRLWGKGNHAEHQGRLLLRCVVAGSSYHPLMRTGTGKGMVAAEARLWLNGLVEGPSARCSAHAHTRASHQIVISPNTPIQTPHARAPRTTLLQPIPHDATGPKILLPFLGGAAAALLAVSADFALFKRRLASKDGAPAAAAGEVSWFWMMGLGLIE